ncbi:unnamed protein product, partial [Arabidopsis lyrata]
EIWFCFNNKPMRFSLTEFHLCDWPLLLPDKRQRMDDLIEQLTERSEKTEKCFYNSSG